MMTDEDSFIELPASESAWVARDAIIGSVRSTISNNSIQIVTSHALQKLRKSCLGEWKQEGAVKKMTAYLQ